MRRPAFAELSRLFEYPGPEQEEASRAFPAFAKYWTATPLDRLREEYVATFDMNKDLSLYLTYPVLGDTRDRGMMLAKLKSFYRGCGLDSAPNELPDFLPLVLDFCALAAIDQARDVLSELRTGIEALHRALKKRHSPYAVLSGVLCDIAPKPDAEQKRSAQAFAERGAPVEMVGR